MRKGLPLLLLAVGILSGCVDQPAAPLAPHERAENSEYDTGPMGPTDQYWRSSNELWVYDNQTELGFSNHLPKHELWQTTINHVRHGGARMMRMTLQWDVADPDGNGNYLPNNCLDCGSLHNHLDNFRDNVERALRTGVVPVVVIHGTPAAHSHYNADNGWQGATDAQLATTRAAFTRFVQDMVAMSPGVNFWQIMNEVDGGHWGVSALGGGAFQYVGNGLYTFDRRAQARNYALLMQSVYPAVKQANPDAWVIMSGLTGTPYMNAQADPVSVHNWDFLDEFYAAGGGNYVDFMAVHAYGRPTSDPDGFWDKGAEMLAVMNRYGDGKRPLWLTEFGRGAGGYMRENNNTPPANPGPGFDADQNAFYASALHLLQFHPRFQKALVYNINSENTDVPPSWVPLPTDYSCGNDLLGGPKQNCVPQDYSVGLFRADLVTPRPAYQTIAANGINHNWLFNGYGYGDITVDSPYRNPVGYSYTRNGSSVTIHGVHLNKLYPKRIMFE